MVSVRDDYIGVEMDLVIARCTYLLDDGGSRTNLELCLREAFDLINLPEMKRKAKRYRKAKDKEVMKW